MRSDCHLLAEFGGFSYTWSITTHASIAAVFWKIDHSCICSFMQCRHRGYKQSKAWRPTKASIVQKVVILISETVETAALQRTVSGRVSLQAEQNRTEMFQDQKCVCSRGSSLYFLIQIFLSWNLLFVSTGTINQLCDAFTDNLACLF